jgi:hypothetical protein
MAGFGGDVPLPPLPPWPSGDRETDKRNLAAYRRSCEMFRRMTGRSPPMPNIPPPYLPARDEDPETDRRNQQVYLTLIEWYRDLTGRYPPDYIPPMSTQ